MSLRTIGFSGLLLAWSCAIAEEAPSVSLKKGLPPDVAALVVRVADIQRVGSANFDVV